MMRGTAPGLPSPHPIIAFLPSVFHEDEMVRQLTQGLDDVLGPAVASLDCVGAYLDPRLAPVDFLDLLAAWVGVALDENWPVERRRLLVAHAVEMHKSRGTAHGLQSQLNTLTDGRAIVIDAGESTWSAVPTVQEDTGESNAYLVIEVADDMKTEELIGVKELVAWAKPAHVTHVVVPTTRR